MKANYNRYINIVLLFTTAISFGCLNGIIFAFSDRFFVEFCTFPQHSVDGLQFLKAMMPKPNSKFMDLVIFLSTFSCKLFQIIIIIFWKYLHV